MVASRTLESSTFLGCPAEESRNWEKFLVWDRSEWSVDSVASFSILSCVTLGGGSVTPLSSWDSDGVHLTGGKPGLDLALVKREEWLAQHGYSDKDVVAAGPKCSGVIQSLVETYSPRCHQQVAGLATRTRPFLVRAKAPPAAVLSEASRAEQSAARPPSVDSEAWFLSWPRPELKARAGDWALSPC